MLQLKLKRCIQPCLLVPQHHTVEKLIRLKNQCAQKKVVVPYAIVTKVPAVTTSHKKVAVFHRTLKSKSPLSSPSSQATLVDR